MPQEDNEPFNTRILMTASAAFLGLVGFTTAFFSDEILRFFGHQAQVFPVVLIKVTAGLYFGFAVLNWMARGNLIGGIYSRPVALANLTHFMAVALIVLKRLPSTAHTLEYAVLAGVNGVFAAAFGFITFRGGGSGAGASCG